MKRIFYILTVLLCMACADDDNFSTSSALKLDFSVDTLKLDTVFSRTPSSTYTFWVHNRNDEGIRLSSVRLKRGNQSGFRVNVDGSYLDNANGAVVSDLEIRRKDSLLVFVELTAPETHQPEPSEIADELVFSIESGKEQSVRLQAWAWAALKLYDPIIVKDSVIESMKPLIIYGEMRVEEGVTLNLRNTTLFFHDGSGMAVYGSLKTENCLMRGDRLDRMFPYLPYDRVSGQWSGIQLFDSSKNNILINTEIRNSINGLVCQSQVLDTTAVKLRMEGCIVHNGQGVGVQTVNSNVVFKDCQLSNMQRDCMVIIGGMAEISYCTLAQFYPFSGDRGAALHFTNEYPLTALNCEGLILTGYEDDVLKGEQKDGHAFDYHFKQCLLRTPKVDDSAHFEDVIWETPNDSIQGKQHFVTVDEDNLIYDFHLDAKSPAQGLGCYR